MVHDLQIRAPYLKREEGAVAKKCSNVPTGFTLSVISTVCRFFLVHNRGLFSTGAMGALAPAILKNRLLAPSMFGHFSTVGKNCRC